MKSHKNVDCGGIIEILFCTKTKCSITKWHIKRFVGKTR